MRITVDAAGTRAAIYERERAVLVALPSGERIGELRFSGEDDAHTVRERDIGWLGDRLFVATQHASDEGGIVTHVAAYAVVRGGVRAVVELQIDEPVRLRATLGTRALLVGPVGTHAARDAYVMTLTADDQLAPAMIAVGSDAAPVAFGASGCRFVVGRGDRAIVEWDPETAKVARELAVADGEIRWCGATDTDRAWWVTREAPARLGGRVLPAPIAAVASAPGGEIVIAVVEDGRAFAIDLSGDGIAPLPVPDRVVAIAAARGRAVVRLANESVSVVAVAPASAADPWRGRLVAWSSEHALPPPELAPIRAACARHAIDRALEPAIALLYAAGLTGDEGCAPVDIAAVSRHAGWREALGSGQLAARAHAIYAASRVRLSDRLRRELDDVE